MHSNGDIHRPNEESLASLDPGRYASKVSPPLDMSEVSKSLTSGLGPDSFYPTLRHPSRREAGEASAGGLAMVHRVIAPPGVHEKPAPEIGSKPNQDIDRVRLGHGPADENA